jgi:hypothetical protein
MHPVLASTADALDEACLYLSVAQSFLGPRKPLKLVHAPGEPLLLHSPTDAIGWRGTGSAIGGLVASRLEQYSPLGTFTSNVLFATVEPSGAAWAGSFAHALCRALSRVLRRDGLPAPTEQAAHHIVRANASRALLRKTLQVLQKECIEALTGCSRGAPAGTPLERIACSLAHRDGCCGSDRCSSSCLQDRDLAAVREVVRHLPSDVGEGMKQLRIATVVGPAANHVFQGVGVPVGFVGSADARIARVAVEGVGSASGRVVLLNGAVWRRSTAGASLMSEAAVYGWEKTVEVDDSDDSDEFSDEFQRKTQRDASIASSQPVQTHVGGIAQRSLDGDEGDDLTREGSARFADQLASAGVGLLLCSEPLSDAIQWSLASRGIGCGTGVSARELREIGRALADTPVFTDAVSALEQARSKCPMCRIQLVSVPSARRTRRKPAYRFQGGEGAVSGRAVLDDGGTLADALASGSAEHASIVTVARDALREGLLRPSERSQVSHALDSARVGRKGPFAEALEASLAEGTEDEVLSWLVSTASDGAGLRPTGAQWVVLSRPSSAQANLAFNTVTKALEKLHAVLLPSRAGSFQGLVCCDLERAIANRLSALHPCEPFVEAVSREAAAEIRLLACQCAVNSGVEAAIAESCVVDGSLGKCLQEMALVTNCCCHGDSVWDSSLHRQAGIRFGVALVQELCQLAFVIRTDRAFD